MLAVVAVAQQLHRITHWFLAMAVEVALVMEEEALLLGLAHQHNQEPQTQAAEAAAGLLMTEETQRAVQAALASSLFATHLI
jgi:hypothetical protein